MSSNYVVLLLGSNKNNPQNNIINALGKIDNFIGKIVKKSKIIESKAIEFDSINNFCNIAIGIKCDLSPIKLLKELKLIELNMGRHQDSKALGGYFDREMDIDIISYNGIFFQSSNLTIPHFKHVFERDFSRELLEDIDYYTKQHTI